ncbi:hypothetical protein ARMSODRAFT_584665 [Armillaria solidipes]|uniref:Uncharacterized protein n=1 Tax=Armillaria solidipes TaxID=1076256 RepID=A0A2H3BTW3_9AGAR|nr:hypothetical protein ARMSODRAFT_584665 [Armillaria solidipes]
MVVDLEADMKRDRRNVQALKDNLRDYCNKAQGAYFGVAELSSRFRHVERRVTSIRYHGSYPSLNKSTRSHRYDPPDLSYGSFVALPDIDECYDKIPKPEWCGAVGCPFSWSSSHEPAYEAPVPPGASGLSLIAPGPTVSSSADDPPTRPASPMRSSSSSGSSTPGEAPRIKVP